MTPPLRTSVPDVAKPEQLELPFEDDANDAYTSPPCVMTYSVGVLRPQQPSPLMVAWYRDIPMFVMNQRYTGIITNIEPVEPPE